VAKLHADLWLFYMLITNEARNPKLETRTNVQNRNFSNKNSYERQRDVSNFGNLDFEFVSDFDIRVSYLTQLA